MDKRPEYNSAQSFILLRLCVDVREAYTEGVGQTGPAE